MHVIMDHLILETILNNVSAITGRIAPSSECAGGVELFGLVGKTKVELDAGTLVRGHT